MSGDRWRLVLATVAACLGADTAFGALFRGWGWLGPTFAVVVVIVAVSEAVRRSPLPSALGPLLAAAAAVLFVTATDASSTAVAGFLPGTAARHALVDQLHLGARVVHHYAAPVPDRRGAVLLAVIGIAAVALVVDLCALTLERAVFAGPPLLAVYVVAAMLTHHGVGWFPFVLAAAGFLLLLAADTATSRRRWGRRFGSGSGSLAVPAGLGQRLGAGALLAAVLVPVAVPRLHADLATTGPHTTNNDIVTLNPLVSIDADLHGSDGQPVLSYTSTSTDPGYLRLTALDAFDGVNFSAVELRSATSIPVTADSVLDPAGTVGQKAVTTNVTVDGLDAHWAPVPENVGTAQIGKGWMFDPGTSTVWSSSADTVGLSLVAESSPQLPSAAALRSVSYADLAAAGPPQLDLAVPASIPSSVIRLAHSLRRSTPYATAVAIQDFFLSGRFSYDLSAPSTASASALTTFLFHTRAGFCQQFSASMAVLARIDGIPARVAVGFTRGTPEGNGTWVVTGADAHAWPELDFPDLGWLPFEPTPRADGQVALPAYAAGPAGHGNNGNSTKVNKGGGRSGRKNPASPTGPKPSHPSGIATAPIAHQAGGGAAWPVVLAVLLVLVLALVVPAGSRLANRRRHAHATAGAAAAHAAWDEVRDTVLDLGGEWPEGHSPARSAELLVRDIPELRPVSAALDRIAVAEAQARYARTVTVDVGQTLRADVGAVKHVLVLRAGRTARVRALVLPRSTIASLRRAATVRGASGAGQRSNRRWNRSSSRARSDRRGPLGRAEAPGRRGSRIRR